MDLKQLSDKLYYELLLKENPTPILRLKVTPSPMKQYSGELIIRLFKSKYKLN